MKAGRLAWLMGAALLAAGCAGLLPARQADPRRDYQRALKAHLTEAKLYKGPASLAFAKALPLTPAMARAWARRAAAATGQPEASFAPPPGVTVILALYTHDDQANDLERPRPTWRMFLQNQAGRRLPPRDRRLVRDPAGLVEVLYPFKDAWSKLYRVSFPGPGEAPEFFRAGGLKLILAGPGGELAMALPAFN